MRLEGHKIAQQMPILGETSGQMTPKMYSNAAS